MRVSEFCTASSLQSDALAGRRYAVCVGAAKAGTTSLYTLMSRHPEVAVSVVKETDFYADDKLYKTGFERYIAELFAVGPRTRVLFEADPIYMYGRGCIARLHACASQARIIVMLRNPVERAFSQYLYRIAYRRYEESFAEMCAREPERIAVNDAARMEFGCLDRSRYAPQIEEIFRYFPRDQVYFILFEEFTRNQRVILRDLQRWLGLGELDLGEAHENASGGVRSVLLARLMYHSRFRGLRGVIGRLLVARTIRSQLYEWLGALNVRPYRGDKPRLDEKLRARLMAEFDADILMVERLTGLNLSIWRSS
jgi:hypothetical protein